MGATANPLRGDADAGLDMDLDIEVVDHGAGQLS